MSLPTRLVSGSPDSSNGCTNHGTGSHTARYDIGWSALCEPSGGYALEKIQISGGKYVTAGLTFSRGKRERPSHTPNQNGDYIGRLKTISGRLFVIYDVQHRRAWLLNAINVLLHLTRAYMTQDFKRYRPKDSTPELRVRGNQILGSIGSMEAYNILSDRENMQTRLHAKDGSAPNDDNDQSTAYYCLSDLVIDLLSVLEQILSHQADKRMDKSVGHRIQLSPAKNIEGFDFMDIATKSDLLNARATTLQPGGVEWSRFIRAVDAPVLFGNNFGDMLEPVCEDNSDQCTKCFWNCACPVGFDTLAVPISELSELAKRRGEKLGSSWRLIEDFYLDIPDYLFRRCSSETCENHAQPRIQRLHREVHEAQEQAESTQLSFLQPVSGKLRRLYSLFGRPETRLTTQNTSETIEFSQSGVLIGLPPPEANQHGKKLSVSTARSALHNLSLILGTSRSSQSFQTHTPATSVTVPPSSDIGGINRNSKSATISKPTITSTGVAVTSTKPDPSNDMQAKGKGTDHRVLPSTETNFTSPLLAPDSERCSRSTEPKGKGKDIDRPALPSSEANYHWRSS